MDTGTGQSKWGDRFAFVSMINEKRTSLETRQRHRNAINVMYSSAGQASYLDSGGNAAALERSIIDHAISPITDFFTVLSKRGFRGAEIRQIVRRKYERDIYPLKPELGIDPGYEKMKEEVGLWMQEHPEDIDEYDINTYDRKSP